MAKYLLDTRRFQRRNDYHELVRIQKLNNYKQLQDGWFLFYGSKFLNFLFQDALAL